MRDRLRGAELQHPVRPHHRLTQTFARTFPDEDDHPRRGATHRAEHPAPERLRPPTRTASSISAASSRCAGDLQDSMVTQEDVDHIQSRPTKSASDPTKFTLDARHPRRQLMINPRVELRIPVHPPFDTVVFMDAEHLAERQLHWDEASTLLFARRRAWDSCRDADRPARLRLRREPVVACCRP